MSKSGKALLHFSFLRFELTNEIFSSLLFHYYDTTMSTTNKTVLIIGPGFIGWNVLDILVAEGYSVTGFVRRKEHGLDIKGKSSANDEHHRPRWMVC